MNIQTLNDPGRNSSRSAAEARAVGRNRRIANLYPVRDNMSVGHEEGQGCAN